MAAVSAQNLMHRFGRHVVFTELSLSAVSGQIVAITGRNGSGKSTLVKILAGLLRPTRGSVQWGRADSDKKPEVGLVAPYVNLYKELTLRENLQFIGKLRRMRLEGSDLARVIANVGLSGAEDKVLRAYSTGMLQRARFASALLHAPCLLLLDEPTIGLDRFGYNLCIQVVRDLRQAGGTVIIASNAQRDVELAGETVCIEDFAPDFKGRT